MPAAVLHRKSEGGGPHCFTLHQHRRNEGISVPYLRFKGFPRGDVEQLAPLVVEEFAHIVKVPQEIVKIELLPVEPILNSPLSLEIMMFPREQAIHNDVAARLHSLLKEYGHSQVHIFFILLNRALYYKEGQPLE